MDRWNGYAELYHKYDATSDRIKREKSTESCLKDIDKKINDIDTKSMSDTEIRLAVCEIIDDTYSKYGLSLSDENFNKLATKYTKSLCHSLYHWGIPNMRWGRRRYQYEDGSLTPEGRERYGRTARRRAARQAIRDAAPYSFANAVTDMNADLKRREEKFMVKNLTDDEITDASKRIDMENSLLSKEIEQKKKIGEKSVPRYMEILGDVKDFTGQVSGITKDAADVVGNIYKIKDPKKSNDMKDQLKKLKDEFDDYKKNHP